MADDESIVFPHANGRFYLEATQASIKNTEDFIDVRKIKVFGYDGKEIGSWFRL